MRMQTSTLGQNEIVGADEIVGKTLFAKTQVQAKRSPLDAVSVAFTVPAGSSVGVVYSYLAPLLPGRTNLYWMFYDPNGVAYYTEHAVGRYDFTALRQQGVLTTEEKIQQQIEENKPWEEKALDTLKTVAIITVLAFAAVQLVPKLFQSSSPSLSTGG